MSPNEILQLLGSNDALRMFIINFHKHIALDNPSRDISTVLTEDERAMDALGRLLVGDEICAAVAIDNLHILVSSNLNEHSQSKIESSIESTVYKLSVCHKRITVNMNIKAKIFLDDGSLYSLPIEKTLEVGSYIYQSDEEEFMLLSEQEQKCEWTANEHGIAQYPFPISQIMVLNKKLPLDSLEFCELHRKGTLSVNKKPFPDIIFRLDPLFRRSSAVFVHLGSLCGFFEVRKEYGPLTNPEQLERVNKDIAVSRRRVMLQTFFWEVAKWYNLDKILRCCDKPPEKNLSKKKCRQKREQDCIKRSNIKQLQQFIETLTNIANNYILIIHIPVEFDFLIKDIQKCIKNNIEKNKINLPDIINNNERLEKFLTVFVDYYKVLLFLEQYIIRRCIERPGLFTYTLARLFEHEYENKQNVEKVNDVKLEIIDTQLSKDTHAEIRLFYYLMIQQKRVANQIPYFGITQLCCAYCNTLLKGHGLNYIQGSVHRAGTHGKNYSNWKLDPSLRSDEVLKPFFGEKLFADFKALSGKIEFNGDWHSLQEWACIIIQDLPKLWYNPSAELQDRIKALGFTHSAIFNDQSNYYDCTSYPISSSSQAGGLFQTDHLPQEDQNVGEQEYKDQKIDPVISSQQQNKQLEALTLQISELTADKKETESDLRALERQRNQVLNGNIVGPPGPQLQPN